MSKAKVFFLWDVRKELRDFLKKQLSDVPTVRLEFPSAPTDEFLIEAASNAEIVVGWRPTREFLDAACKMRLFINPGAGVQHHLEPFRELNKTRKVILVNGHGNSYFAAQHAVAMLLALMNKIIPHHNWMAEGHWRRGDDHAVSIPLRYRTIGLLGYGHVNSKVHQFLTGFNNDFCILKKSWTGEESMPTPARKYVTEELEEFLEVIDILIVAVPETDETEGLLQFHHLEKLGSDSLLVNIARGGVIDETGLYKALKEKAIAGAALDVWYEYRPEPDESGQKYPYSHPFHELDNVVLSPHRAASPFSDLERWTEVVENIRRYATGRIDFLNIVDLERGY
ncbi:MAG: NAD(P)-dependent oxidoreductase [Candidatus Thorarchaeota archaeon]